MQFVFQKFHHEMKRKLLVQCIYISVLFVKEAFLHFPEKNNLGFINVLSKNKNYRNCSAELCALLQGDGRQFYGYLLLLHGDGKQSDGSLLLLHGDGRQSDGPLLLSQGDGSLL